MASSTNHVPGPSRRGGRLWLFAAAFFSGALALFLCYDTWLGMRGYAGGRLETLAASVGLLGVIYVFAWLLALSLMGGQTRRFAGLSVGYLLAVVPAVLFCTAALYFNLSTSQSLQAVADLAGSAVGRRVIEPLDRKLQAEQERSAHALQQTAAYVQWSGRVDQLMDASAPAAGPANDHAPASVAPPRASSSVPAQAAEIRALRQQKAEVDARVSRWDAQIAEQNRLIEKETRGEGARAGGKVGCGDACKNLQSGLMKLLAARTPDLARQGALARQLSDLKAGGSPASLTQLQSELREARVSFKRTGDPARLDAAQDLCRQVQTAAQAHPVGDACALEGLDPLRQDLTALAALRTLFEQSCVRGDPFRGIAFEAGLTLGEKCLGLARPAPVSLSDEQRSLQQLRQAYSYLPLLKDPAGSFIRNLSPLRNDDKVQISVNGLRNHDPKFWMAAALAVIFNLLIPALACAGAASRQAPAEASREAAGPSPDIRPIPTDEPHVRAIKLILQSVVTEKGEQILEIEDPCRHADPNVKDIANLLVAERELLPTRRGKRYYRLAPGAYGRLKERLRLALSATVIVTALPPKLESLQPSEPKPPRRGRASFFSGED